MGIFPFFSFSVLLGYKISVFSIFIVYFDEFHKWCWPRVLVSPATNLQCVILRVSLMKFYDLSKSCWLRFCLFSSFLFSILFHHFCYSFIIFQCCVETALKHNFCLAASHLPHPFRVVKKTKKNVHNIYLYKKSV